MFKNRDKYKQSDCIKARNHMSLDFLHLSRNEYLYFRINASNEALKLFVRYVKITAFLIQYVWNMYSSAEDKFEMF